MQRLWVEKTPVHLATTGQGGGAARRLKARLARENWEVKPGFKFRPGFIYTQVRAISARINQNYDGWPADELKKSYRTFIGKPCFVNHQNENPQEARGVVVASRYVENGRDNYVDVIQEIDAQRYPKLAHEIITGGMDSVSMGAEAGFTICSYCKHKATDEHDMCNHVKFHKGEKLAKFNRRTGKTENVLVYESCHKLSFFELSYVFEPADETAVASRVLVAGRRRTASWDSDALEQFQHHSDSCQGNALQSAEENWTSDPDMPPVNDERGNYTDEAWNGINQWAASYLKSGDSDCMCGHGMECDHDPRGFEAAVLKTAGFVKEAPFAGYDDFADCESKNQDKGDTGAYCGEIKHRTEDKKASFEARVLRAVAMGNDCLPGQPCDKAPGLDLAIMPKGTPSGGASGDPASPAAPGGTPAAPGGAPAAPGGGASPGGGAPSKDLAEALARAGIDPSMHPLISGFSAAEGNNPSGAPTLGFTDSQAGTTLDEHAQALAKQFKDRSSVAGEFPKNGTPEQQASWMATVVGQNGVSSDWQGNAQPARSDYVNRIVQNMPNPAESQVIVSNFERRVLHMAGYKTAWTMPLQGADAVSQVGLDTPSVPPLPTPPPPPGPEALAPPPAPAATPTASFERRVLRLAYGEIEAPTPVDTLREEGSAPEDANDDFHHYVAPPDGLRDPNLSQAGQFGGQGPQPEQGVGGMGANPEDNPAVDANYMVLKIPMPGTAPPGPMQPPPQPGGAMPPQIPAPPQGQPPGIPMQNFASRSLLAGVDQYLGIDAGATTLGNGRGVSQTSRKPRKGQTMGRSRTSLSQRGKVASQGKRQHFAEGPYTDGGPYGRNDEGEQQDVFLTQPPPPEHVEAPDEDTQDISNTKGNLVARVQQGRAQLLRDAQALAAYQAREGSHRQGEALVGGGGVIDPSVQDSESEALTGDHFEALGEAPVRTDPKQAARQAENSLSAFQAFDKWLHSATGRQARHHTAKNIRLAADEWAKRANYDVKVLFPALGIVLRQARKIEAAQTKGAKMRKRADEKLDLAAPDARIDVEAPTDNTTDAEAQESQFDLSDFADNAGDSLADPDLSTDSQFWAPGEGSKKSSSQQPRKATPAGGILAVRAAEAYINAGLERPESKYQLAGLFENMNKGVVQRDIALLERVAQLQSQTRQKVASGKTRGAAPSLPAGLSSGGMRVASVQRMAANDPSNDALLFD